MKQTARSPLPIRFHGLDAFRSFAMLGGVIIHAAMAHTYPEIKIWPVQNQDGSLAFTLLLFTLHAFRLQAFFLLAGFFTGLLVERRGIGKFVINRLMRIALPLAISVLTLLPMIQALFVWGYERRGYPGIQRIGVLYVEMPEYYGKVSEFFLSGRALAGFHWFHLWFLWYLVAIYVAWIPLERFFSAWLVWQHPNPDDADRAKTGFNWRVCAAYSLAPLVLAIPTACLMGPMKIWQADSPMGFWPELPILTYYFFFFLIGRLLYRQQVLLAQLQPATWWYLGCGVFIALPIMLGLQMFGPQESSGYRPAWKWPALLAYSTFTWLMILGWLGFFLRYFQKPVGWISYLSESAYWQYLAHLPPLLLFQILIADASLPIWLKFFLVAGSVYLMLLLSYHYLVRSTIVGQLLNGRRTPRKETT